MKSRSSGSADIVALAPDADVKAGAAEVTGRGGRLGCDGSELLPPCRDSRRSWKVRCGAPASGSCMADTLFGPRVRGKKPGGGGGAPYGLNMGGGGGAPGTRCIGGGGGGMKLCIGDGGNIDALGNDC